MGTLKTLTEYLVETDTEFDVTILSIKNIQSAQLVTAIERVLGRYELRSFELGKVSALLNGPEKFPDAGVVRTYEIKAKTGLFPCPINLCQEISIETGVSCKGLDVAVSPMPEEEIEDDDYEPLVGVGMGDHARDKSIGDPKNKNLVGQSRVSTILADLKREHQETEAKRRKRQEKVVVSHLGIKEVLGESVLKGFYECTVSHGKLTIDSGPTRTLPKKGGEYLTSTSIIRSRIAESDTGSVPPCSNGDVIRLISMPDDPSPIEPGAIGTVIDVTELHMNKSVGVEEWQISVKWESGRTLNLITPHDEFEIIKAD